MIGKISRSYCIGARVKCKASEFGQKWAQDHYGNDKSAWRSAWTEGTIEAVDGTKKWLVRFDKDGAAEPMRQDRLRLVKKRRRE